ncbi:hypothetical protein [Prosthecochloris sp. HL-130-GSB]|uniref:hypothetical protein n=1 Tax=Prosthecochloris sp. HL-130-GSB TaxID=1974213 RepID=UPI000A1C1318|nr:hypothetical protein [Prosthecochloris sp. HL-130-GSB]ARM30462.1 hypothetical protein B9H02_02855 [Prosthecochloris sp. HL-130-GSB]
MQKKLLFLVRYSMVLALCFLLIILFNQLYTFASILESIHPALGYTALLAGSSSILYLAVISYRLWQPRKLPKMPDNESSPEYQRYVSSLGETLPVHPKHPKPDAAPRDARWTTTNLKLLEVDALGQIKEIATKNFFLGAFAQNTSYGTTTSMLNNLKLVWRIYRIHQKNQHIRGYLDLCRFTYEALPLSDFSKEELPTHIKPVIQSAFSNTLASLLPGGNLLTPFFMNLFLAGATNTYLTCLSGIISLRRSQALTAEETSEIVQQSKFEASFMLKEIVRDCNPILSVTVSKAVKNAGVDSLDSVQSAAEKGNLAQDIVSHLAHSLKTILRENVTVEKGK